MEKSNPPALPPLDGKQKVIESARVVAGKSFADVVRASSNVSNTSNASNTPNASK